MLPRLEALVLCLGALLACDDGASTDARDLGSTDPGPDLAAVDAAVAGDAGKPAPLQPDGAACTDASECENTCYVLPMFGGTCGDCASDADCAPGGCDRPSLTTPPTPPRCHAGGLGGTCESNDACQADLTCVSVISNALLDVAGCSACVTSMECADGTTCQPAIDLAGLSGHQRCVADGDLEIGETCAPGSDGAAACASGVCAIVEVQGAAVGVCSECAEDPDCGDPGSCSVAALDLTVFALVPGRCR